MTKLFFKGRKLPIRTGVYHNSLVYPFSYGSFKYWVCERNKDSDTSKEQKVKKNRISNDIHETHLYITKTEWPM